jgi:hypothetical protein
VLIDLDSVSVVDRDVDRIDFSRWSRRCGRPNA